MAINLVKADGPESVVSPWLLDPLDKGFCNEEVLHLNRRALVRIALVASEAGARFQREGLSQDPMAWMLSPRRMFWGATAN